MKLQENGWYVYSHKVGSKLIYIGMGNHLRPFNLSARSPKWKSLAKGKPVNVSILHTFTKREDAAKKEADLIAELQPAGNTEGKIGEYVQYTNHSGGIIDTCIAGIKIASKLTGVSRRQACIRSGIHEATLRRFMNEETDMRLGTMVAICEKGFGISFQKLLALGGG